MKRLLRAAGHRLAPQITAGVLAARARAHSHRYLAGLGMADLNRRLSARFGECVVEGPFAGMRLPPGAWQEQLGPFLLGTYERELHPWVERIIASCPARVIDVGSKFGYYTIGLARRLSAADVIAYDTDPWAREQTWVGADLNDVAGRVRVRGFCSPPALRADLIPRTVVLSDCEGYESKLFPPGCRDAYAGVTLLVETHEAVSPGVGARLGEEFSGTHVFEQVAPVEGRYAGPPLDFLVGHEIASAVHEIRGEQAWLLFTPK